MAQREVKFDWPRDQFLNFRVQWPSERGVKCENGKLKRGSRLEFRSLKMGREATSKPSHLLSFAADKRWGTRQPAGHVESPYATVSLRSFPSSRGPSACLPLQPQSSWRYACCCSNRLPLVP